MAQLVSAQKELFVYTPLPTSTSIRLLRLLGRNDDGLLNFVLETVDLNDEKYYHCLSYTWGNPHANGTMFQNDFEAVESEYSAAKVTSICCNGKILKVRQNLYDALCQIPPSRYMYNIVNRSDNETKRIELHDRAREGNPAVIRFHLVHGAQVNSRDCFGRIPLHYAASNGHVEIAKLLIKAGSDIMAYDNEKKTPKNHALENGYLYLADLLDDWSLDDGKAVSAEVPDFTEFGSDTFLWIDAICIDQENLKERAAQVSIMDRIYSDAAYVLAWLGRKDRFTMTAVETIAKLVHSGENFANSDLVPYRTQSSAEYKESNVDYISQADWNALASLFLRQWFRRIWVIQEVVFAGGLLFYCGDIAIQWADIAYSMSVIRRRFKVLGYHTSTIYVPLTDAGLPVEYFFQSLYSFREVRFDLESSKAESLYSKYNLIQLIIETFPFFATDPRDKVFALSALMTLNPQLLHRPIPDYQISVEHCYSRITHIALESTKDLEVLSLVQDRSMKNIGRLPSWVPDFSLQGSSPLSKTPFTPCGNLASRPDARIFVKDLIMLCLTGVEFDVIHDTADARPLGGANKKAELDSSWFDLILKLDVDQNYQNTDQSLTEALWRVLCVDQGPNGEHPAPLEFGQMFKTFVCAMFCAESERQARAVERENENVIALIESMVAGFKVQQEAVSGLRGLDEDYVSNIRKDIAIQHRTLNSSFFDSVRPTLSKLESLVAKRAGDFMPTLQEVEAYSLRSMDPITNPQGTMNVPPEISSFVYTHSSCYSRRRLFLTRKGYLGLGPVSLETGDVVWILPGAKAPFVLRPVTHAGLKAAMALSSYNLIGEAYVHGIMHGEAIGKDESVVELQKIALI